MILRHLAAAALFSCLAFIGLLGCAHRTAVPHRPADVPGYDRAPPELGEIDPSPLRGRRIVVDAGHGGYFRGAVGDGGLSEAEVNLGVALYLQGLLQWAGADVHLTRTVDRDFLTRADSSLAGDLATRVAISDSLSPDVFLSIHHNSTASRDPDINETQTYYPLGREGADLDLARAIHRQLVRALAIEPAKILPGGFHVLRHASVPAVLGEPAMLSNPVIEGRLSLARSLELEARAYFLGLLDYFAAGSPRWATDLPDTISLRELHGALSWTFDPGEPAAPGLDPQSVQVTVDGRPLTPTFDPTMATISIAAAELQSAQYIVVAGRNLAGRATRPQQHTLDRRGGGTWQARFIRDGRPDPPRGLLTYVNDEVELMACTPFFAAPSSATVPRFELPLYPGHRGWLVIAGERVGSQALAIYEQEPTGEGAVQRAVAAGLEYLPRGTYWQVLRTPAASWPDATVPGHRWRSRNGMLPVTAPSWPVVPRDPDATLWLEADGALPLVVTADDGTPWGYAIAFDDTLTWQPLLPTLVGRRVAIDPRGGGTDDQGRGPYGTRGSDLNLQIAARVASTLRGAGCEVLVLRNGEAHTPAAEKVRRADVFGADFYLTLGRGKPTVRHHPGSQLGTPWATHSAQAFAPLLSDTVRIEPAYDYVLRHTACPAIVVVLETPRSAADEDRLKSAGWQDTIARAVLRGLVDTVQPATPFIQIPDVVAALGSRALPGSRLDHARLDGNFSWLPPAGQVPAAGVPSWIEGDPGLPAGGDHHLLELHAGPHWQLWALFRDTTGQWRGDLVLENR